MLIHHVHRVDRQGFVVSSVQVQVVEVFDRLEDALLVALPVVFRGGAYQSAQFRVAGNADGLADGVIAFQ